MGAKRVLVSTGVGVALFTALSVAAMLTMVGFMFVAGAADPEDPSAAFAGMFVGLGMMMLLLLTGPLEGLIVGAVVGLRHRGDWKGALPAGLLTGLLGFLAQFFILTMLLLAVVRLIGIPGEAFEAGGIAAGSVAMTALLGVPAALVCMVAALATASAFRPGAEPGDGGDDEDETPAPAAPTYVPAPAPAAAAAPPPAAPLPLPNPAAILGATAAPQGAPPPAAAMAGAPGSAPPPAAAAPPAAAPPAEGAPKKPNWAP